MADGMGDKANVIDQAKGLHLGGDHGIGTASLGHDHTGVVDDALRTTSLHKSKSTGQKHLGLKAGKARIVLKVEPSRKAQRQAGALGAEGFAGDKDPMRRGVVLGFFAGTKAVGAGTLDGFSQLEFPHHPGQAAVGDLLPMKIFKDFGHTHHVSLAAFKQVDDIGNKGFEITLYRLCGAALTPQQLAHRIAGHFEQR